MSPAPPTAPGARHQALGPDRQTVDGVHTTLRRFAAGWSSRCLQEVADLWDREGAHLSYVAEELGEVLSERTQISDHLLRSQQRLHDPHVSVGEVSVSSLAGDLALVTFLCRWELEWTSYSRVGAVLRRRGERWYFVHYMESPFHVEDWERVEQL